MSLTDVMARLRPTARNRYQNEAGLMGVDLESYIQEKMDTATLGEDDLINIQGGKDSIWPFAIWPADREGGD